MKIVHLLVGIAGLWGAAAVTAQTYPGQYTWEEFSKRVQSSEKVAPLGPTFAGDKVSLSNGALSFAATDVSLPGNNALKVEFARTYSVFSRKDYWDLGMLADWVVDVPSINAVLAPNWVVGPTYSTNRCSDGSIPRASTPFTSFDFWQGLTLNIPWVSSAELLRTLPGVAKPTDGQTYYWLTNDRVHVACLSTIKNGTGQGFLAVTPDGTRYWFDWMGQTNEAASYSVVHYESGAATEHMLTRRKNYLYATRVEDRFGNVVSYTYTNAWNQPGRLTKIEGTDGRRLTVSYTGNTVSSVSDGTRTWTYGYGTTTSGRKTLVSVGLPDLSSWSISLGQFTNAEIKYLDTPPGGEIMRTCTTLAEPLNLSSSFVGTITHPAGAVAQFTLGIREHGRSWVPVSCRNVKTTVLSGPSKGIDNNKNDDINTQATSAYSLTLTNKSISGPGQAVEAWSYGYQPNTSVYFHPGTTPMWPVCDSSQYNCAAPVCTSDSCAQFSVTVVAEPNGEVVRYVFGNTYRYNEGKLLRVEHGGTTGQLLRTTTNFYDLSRVDQVYPARFGDSQRSGDGFATEYHRPEVRTETIQQGVMFVRQVDEFDTAARPVQLTRSSNVLADPNAPNLGAPALSVPASAVSGVAQTLSWTTVAGATLYQLERSIDGGSFFYISMDATTSRTHTYPSAATLKFRVRGCNAYGGCGTYSAEQTMVVSAAPLPPPPAFGTPTLTASSQTGVGAAFSVSWTAVAGATQYVLERKNGSGAYAVIYSGGGTTPSQTMVFYSATNTLKHRVKACDTNNNCGSYSNEATTQVIASGGGGGGGGIEP